MKEEQRRILENYGTVFAPDIDYSREHIQPLQILQNYPDIEFNVIIGSSLGALNGCIISDWIGRPALLFNPPLSKHPENIDLPKEKFTRVDSSKQILLEGKDVVVDPKETLAFLRNLNKNEPELKIIPGLGHRIPIELFESQVSHFFSKLCY